MRLTPALVAVALVLAAAGCGGDDKAKGTNFGAIGPIGKGAAGVWIYTPKGKPKDLVVYFHGQGGPQEATPVNHLAWINHLVRRGSVVIYPRYEMAYEVDPEVAVWVKRIYAWYVDEGVSIAADTTLDTDQDVFGHWRSRSRLTITRMIWLVPSRIEWTRRSRQKRSIG